MPQLQPARKKRHQVVFGSPAWTRTKANWTRTSSATITPPGCIDAYIDKVPLIITGRNSEESASDSYNLSTPLTTRQIVWAGKLQFQHLNMIFILD